ncbi:MAG: type II secretion system protein [Kiritimatiellae bacterium]|nr:type II secretion system protein [Kiritimatiellia bacterium]
MKKAFTLLELMIAIAVLVTLMGLVFRLNITGSDNKARIETVLRMQKLENCISGYYAAFGSYPPVKLHGSRNYKLKTNDYGVQMDVERGTSSADGGLNWGDIEAACRAQPVGCRFPFPEGMSEIVKKVSEELADKASKGAFDGIDAVQRAKLEARFNDGLSENPGRYNDYSEATDWRDIRLYRFGLMSYLLPRYLVMMRNYKGLEFNQWKANNDLPYKAIDGDRFQDWDDLLNDSNYNEDGSLDQDSSGYANVANIPSQAVCARWMLNLEGICTGNYPNNLYGIKIIKEPVVSELRGTNPNIEIFRPTNQSDQGEGDDDDDGQYVLDGITVKDGWDNEFYYYSPAPYQRYILWSAGKNRRTFPPWVDRTILKAEGAKVIEKVSEWIEDDIIHLSN